MDDKTRISLCEKTVNAVVSAIENGGSCPPGHHQRVTHLASAIAKAMNRPEGERWGLMMAASIHGIGRVEVPAYILAKAPVDRSSAEQELFEQHSEKALELLEDVPYPRPVSEVVVQHRERIDGSGYPRGLEGNQILLEARILGVADTIDHKTCINPYRPACSTEETLDYITKYKGKLYDPDVVDACLQVFEGGFELGSDV